MGLGTPVIQRRADGADRSPIRTTFWHKLLPKRSKSLLGSQKAEFQTFPKRTAIRNEEFKVKKRALEG